MHLSLRSILCVALLNALAWNGHAQVQGKLIHGLTGAPIPGASIQWGSLITRSDSAGLFKLPYSHNSDTLRISVLGFSTHEALLTPQSNFTIQMNPIALGIPEIKISTNALDLITPVPFHRVNRKAFERDFELSPEPALNRVPGVYMHTGALNTNRITIRGIGSRSPFSTTKIRAYLNDIPITTGDGTTSIEDIDLGLIQNVDVWKGPSGSLYGAGLGGVIRLSTQTEPQPSGAHTSIDNTIGSFGLYRTSGQFAFTNSDQKLTIRTNLNHTQSDGYRENNEYSRSGGMLLMQLKSDPKNETFLLANYTQLRSEIPSSLNESDFNTRPHIAAANWAAVQGFEDYQKTLIGLSHKAQISQSETGLWLNQTSLYSNTFLSYESRPFNILEERSHSVGARSVFEWTPFYNNKTHAESIQFGLEGFSENYFWETLETNAGTPGELLSVNREKRSYLNGFGQFTLSIKEKTRVLGGININKTNYDYQDRFHPDSLNLSGGYGFNWIASPRIGLQHRISPRHHVFISLSHGMSAPTLEETLTPGGTINPAIRPERGWSLDWGSKGKLGSQGNYEVNFFHMLVRDLLVARRTAADQFVGINAGKTRHSGVECYADYTHPFSKGTLAFFLNYSYSNFVFLEFIELDQDFSGNQLTGTPPHHLGLGTDIQVHNGFYSEINFQLVDAYPLRDDNTVYTDSYTLSHLKAGWAFDLSNSIKMNISLGIRNAMNTQYASMALINASGFGGSQPRYYYPGLPRHYVGSVRFSF